MIKCIILQKESEISAEWKFLKGRLQYTVSKEHVRLHMRNSRKNQTKDISKRCVWPTVKKILW